jgi:hypothetical protein
VDLDEALTWLLGDARTGALPDDDIAAARASMDVREMNSRAGAAVLADLRRQINPATGKPYTLREMAEVTGIPKDTIARWSRVPRRAE